MADFYLLVGNRLGGQAANTILRVLFVIGTNGKARVLARIPLSQGSDGTFAEAWLQNALFTHPECLPVREIDPHIGALIPVCTELDTGAGQADILYVTLTGQLVLVETKRDLSQVKLPFEAGAGH